MCVKGKVDQAAKRMLFVLSWAQACIYVDVLRSYKLEICRTVITASIDIAQVRPILAIHFILDNIREAITETGNTRGFK